VNGAPALAIETIGLAKRFARTTALGDLTLEVGRGEIFGFLGPNGAGKTTAIKLLLGLARPSAGAAEVLGAPLGDRAARRKIGYLPELFRYQEWLAASEVLAFHARLLGLPRAGRYAEIARVLEIAGLSARAGDRVGTYSKGMQQRLGIAVALLGEPDLVFLDEPTSALDPLGRRDVRVLIEDLRRAGTTVFLNSHLLTEVERVCDRIAVVDRGRVVASGTVAELLGRGPETRLLLGNVGPAAAALLARAAAHRAAAATALDLPPEAAWYAVSAPLDAMPPLVAALVHAGAAVYAVEAVRATLEERFLELLREENADDRRRLADPA